MRVEIKRLSSARECTGLTVYLGLTAFLLKDTVEAKGDREFKIQ